MFSFKQFLTETYLAEGGKATAAKGTVRANKKDVVAALKNVSKTIGLSYDHLVDHLLGSTRQTLDGQKKDSGDLDIAVLDDVKRSEYEDKMTSAFGEPRKTGGNVYSYAVPGAEGRLVQVDLMFVPDIEYAKFSYHSEPGSQLKGAVRNLLIYALVLNTPEKGKDALVRDAEGNVVARATRSWQLDTGLKRVFKIAPLRKDGKGRTKTLVKATPEEVDAVAKEYGFKGKFSKEEDLILSPDKMATMLLGDGAKASELKTSAEKLIETIKNKRTDFKQVFKDALADLDRQKVFAGNDEGRALFVRLTGQ